MILKTIKASFPLDWRIKGAFSGCFDDGKRWDWPLSKFRKIQIASHKSIGIFSYERAVSLLEGEKRSRNASDC